MDDKMMRKEEVIGRAVSKVFGKPLVTNVYRSILVEAMIAGVLPETWEWCSQDYNSHDFVHKDGARMEVKQSASWQSWSQDELRPSKISWDIAHRTGYWLMDKWIEEPGRHSDIYAFAHHPVIGPTADHRDPSQWLFYMVPTTSLPDTKRISLAGVVKLTSPVRICSFFDRLERSRDQLQTRKDAAPLA